MTSCGKRVMKEELYMIEKNNTLIDIPLDRKVIVVYDGSIKQSLLGILILIRVVPWKIWRVLQDIVLVLVHEYFFSWCSKKQEIVAKSTSKVEFIATTAVVN